MASNSKTFTFEEVAKHNHKNDCWLIIKGKIYDVTSFLEDHPGGDEALLQATEKDATIDFEDVGHSDSAVEMMQKYYVGEIDASTIPSKGNNSPPPLTQAPANNDQSSSALVKLLQYVLPLLILAFAFGLQYYGKNTKTNDS